jgi:hypothetical protein
MEDKESYFVSHPQERKFEMVYSIWQHMFHQNLNNVPIMIIRSLFFSLDIFVPMGHT